MGLLSQLKTGERKNEIRPEDKQADYAPEDSAGRNAGGNSPVASGTNLSQESPAVCSCGSVLAWRDIYGGGPHCHGCRPWPAERFIRELIGLEPCEPSSVAQAANWRVLWPLDGSDVIPAADRASCGHSRTRSLTAWFGKDGTDRRTGKPILVADLDRVAEAEEFRECVLCGEWIPVSKNEVTA